MAAYKIAGLNGYGKAVGSHWIKGSTVELTGLLKIESYGILGVDRGGGE